MGYGKTGETRWDSISLLGEVLSSNSTRQEIIVFSRFPSHFVS